MKSVAICRFSAGEGPGYFAEFLEARSIPHELICIDEGDSVPTRIDAFAGLCLMGGPMSVNDPLPWIAQVTALIRDAFVKDRPMIGHCLGGQLISKALGGRVIRNRVKEVGWSRVSLVPSPEAAYWFGEDLASPRTVFQWHGETFTLPMQAKRIACSDYCANQIVVLGPHLAMQCHVEMTPEMIVGWCEHWEAEMGAEAPSPSIQQPPEILGMIDVELPALRQLADRLYTRWIESLR